MPNDIMPVEWWLYFQWKVFKIWNIFHQIRFYNKANELGSKEYWLLSSDSHIELSFTKKELEDFLLNKEIIDA